MSAERVVTGFSRPQSQQVATEADIRQKYGDEGYEKIVLMGHKDKIMKNYLDSRFIGNDNYYPKGLSVEDINNNINKVLIREDPDNIEQGIDHRIFKTFKVGDFCMTCLDNQEVMLFELIRNRQLFETKLGIRNSLGHEALAQITTEELNRVDVEIVSQQMDRGELVPEKMEREEVVAVEVEYVHPELIHDDLIRMKQEQDDWFAKRPSEHCKKMFLINLPVYASLWASIYGCVTLGGLVCAALGGDKKRKNNKKSLKKKRKSKRRKSLKKKQRKTKRKGRK